MTELRIGYTGCPPTIRTSPPSATPLAALDVAPDRIYVDHGLTGTNRDRPGLRGAMAACRAGVLVVTKLDRLSARQELFSITRSTVYRALARDRARATT